MRGFRQYTNLPFQGIFMSHQHHPIFSIQPANDFPCQPPNSRAISGESTTTSPHLRGSPQPAQVCLSKVTSFRAPRPLPWAAEWPWQCHLGDGWPWAFPVTWRPGNRQWI